jgi:putative transposase
MAYDPEKHRRRSIRMQGYDYSAPGAYFITMCTHHREHLFGNIVLGEMHLNQMGTGAKNIWLHLTDDFPWIMLDTFVFMPDHFHAIFWIRDSGPLPRRNPGGKWDLPLQTPCGTSKTVGSVVRGFKIRVTQWARMNNTTMVVWHRNYHERVIRNDLALNRIRRYILENPVHWNEKGDADASPLLDPI